MKFGLAVVHNSGCLRFLLGHWSSFHFSIEGVLVSRFVPTFKCTVNKKLETLITLHSKVLCN